MITGAHTIIYSKNADADRAFFKDVLHWPHVDAGRGWLIFAAPPSELAVHPTDDTGSHELYLMCDDIKALVRDLTAKKVKCGQIMDRGWGLLTEITLPSGASLGIYEPKHPTAIGLTSDPKAKKG